ncbi:MAG: dTMP kinase [Coraliomargaritaceae bacterium]
MSGLFISFEGSEGCGKSTQIEALSDRLQKEGHGVFQAREPGGTPLGEALRQLLQHDDAGNGMLPEAELLLFAAARAQIVRKKLTPALEAGKIVLCDRFVDSTTVYQGVARGLNHAEVAAVNQVATGGLQPDLTILIDLPADIGLERARQRSQGQLDRMEQEGPAFFETVRQGYLELAKAEPERFLVLDGAQSIETLQTTIWNAVQPRLT